MTKILKNLLTFWRYLRSAPWVMDDIWSEPGRGKSSVAFVRREPITEYPRQDFVRLSDGTVVSMQEWSDRHSPMPSNKSPGLRRAE